MTIALTIFVVSYLVIAFQRLPVLHLGRPAGALLGAVAMVAFGVLDFDAALAAIDLDTILFLLGMMIVLAYLESSGFFEATEHAILRRATTARGLLWWTVLSAGGLSAIFMNDTICLMFTPTLIRVARRLELPPVPLLIALAAAANIGSLCTLLGNPQNAMIATAARIPLLPFAAALAPVSIVGLVGLGGLLSWRYRGAFTRRRIGNRVWPETTARQPWIQVTSLLSVLGMLIALACGARPAAAAMTAAAAVILCGARRPREVWPRVDWSLLLFFGGLFVLTRALESAGAANLMVESIAGPMAEAGNISLARFGTAVSLLSQLVSNVPATMLFLPTLQSMSPAVAHPLWLGLAAFSTLAGNLTILGSAANVIVLEIARKEGVEIGFLEHLAVGVPITLITLVVAWAWLLWR
ncbi:MAG: SLC13 family permease [Acidobacteriota bacterium]